MLFSCPARAVWEARQHPAHAGRYPGNRGTPRARARQETPVTQSKSQEQNSHKGGQHASAEGQKGVSQDTVGSGKDKDPNNFANNPARAAEAGRKGGQNSH